MLVIIVRSPVASSVIARLVRAVRHQPVWLGHDDEIAAASFKITVCFRHSNRALRCRAIPQFFRAVNFRDAWNAANGVQHGAQGRRIGFQLLISPRRKKYVCACDAGNGGFRVTEWLESFFDFFLHFGNAESPCIRSRFLHVLRHGNHAMIGAKRNHVISAAHFCIEMLEQLCEIFVESNQNVLNFPTARTERVTDMVGRRITDGQKICPAALSKSKLIHCTLRKVR